MTHTPDPAKELLITDVSVVDDKLYTEWVPGKSDRDPEGAWSFGRQIDNMLADGQRTAEGRSRFVMSWLKTWECDQEINGWVVPARPAIRQMIIEPWREASGCSPAQRDEACTLDMAKAPFRLLAIVNRADLRRMPSESTFRRMKAGEGRFVFGALDAAGEPLRFTVIFEYKLPAETDQEVFAWADRWHALGTLPFGPRFNTELQRLTSDFSGVLADRGKHSALSQIRTNESELSAPGTDPDHLPSTKLWELREFSLEEGEENRLAPATVKREPDMTLSGSELLAGWAKDNEAKISKGGHSVPELCYEKPFLGGSSRMPSMFAWQVPGVTEEVRSKFAKATCNGCHSKETKTQFLHVSNRKVGASSVLSSHLTVDELGPQGERVKDFIELLTTSQLTDGPGLDP